MNTPLKVGIAGFGVVGKRRKLCVDKNPFTALVAVCDQNIQEAASLPEGVKFCKDYHQLLMEDLDILIVCLPNFDAPEATIAGIKKGLHVFCEKPPGRTVEDIERVLETEAQYPDCKLMYGFNHRYHDSVRDALNLVRGGSLGPIINMRGLYGKSQMISFNQTDWRTRRKIAGGGILLDQGIHMVDLMRLFAGEFYDVKSYISNRHWKYDVEDNAYALMSSSSGVIAMLNSSATQWRHRFDLYINLELGSIILSGILSGSKSYGAETLTVARVSEGDQGDPMEFVTRYNNDPSWEKEVNSFVNNIINDEEVVDGSSIDALETMKLVYRIYYADPEWRNRYSIKNPDEVK